jgi:hypothetical protein
MFSMQLLRAILSCVLAVVVPAAMFAADTGAAMIYTMGTTWINGSGVPKNSAIFPGDLIQTKDDAVANINATGSTVVILSDSLIQFENNGLTLEHGAVAVSTGKRMSTHAGEVTVTPASEAWTQFEVSDVDGSVHIAARKGDILIADATGTSTLPQGGQTTRDESKFHKKKKRRAGGAIPGATGPIMDSPYAIGTGLGIIGGVTTWVLLQGDDPLSPACPSKTGCN